MAVGQPYTAHSKVKPEKMAAAARETLDQTLVLPNTFRREGFDAYRGAKGDAVNMRVEGVLPFRRYAFRNDRSQPIETDVYEEKTVQVTVADHFYNATALTDEQKEWDLLDWAFLLGKQARALSRGLARQAQAQIEAAPYNVVIGGAGSDLVGSLTEARRVLNRFQVPGGTRTLAVGSDFEAAMQNDDRIQLASNAGDNVAESALREATIGRVKGFNVVLDNTIAPDAAYAYVDGGFVWATAAPVVPRSIAYGATTSYEGLALRVMQDYVADYLFDRQIADVWSGMRYVTDFLTSYDPTGGAGLGIETVSEEEHFVRGIKLNLDGTSEYPTVGSELAEITGINEADGWEAGVRGDLNA